MKTPYRTKLRLAVFAAPVFCIAIMTGCNKTETTASNEPPSVGQYVDDKTLTGRVDAALNNNPNYKFGDVKVAVSSGTVQLSGFVNTEAEKTSAGDIAKGVEGSKDVVNNISLKPATP